MVVNLMNAVEAAGIANIFSEEIQDRPIPQNAPQRINTSEVNTFSVGSVNGNGAFPISISNFSTRGPKQCPHSGSVALEIHPEVVAPGQNVRSAWGDDNFNTISVYKYGISSCFWSHSSAQSSVSVSRVEKI